MRATRQKGRRRIREGGRERGREGERERAKRETNRGEEHTGRSEGGCNEQERASYVLIK